MSGAVWDWSAADRAALGRFLAAKGLTEPSVTTRPIGDGHSNLTYLVTDGARTVVVRRPPPPPFPPGANDMLREARFLAALDGTAVPAPTVLAIAQEGEVIDVPFYVMSFADGPVVTTVTPPALATPETRREIGLSLVDTLAELHAVDWQAAGMGDLGRPDGFNARHVARMSRLIADADGSVPPPFRDVHAWLTAHAPTESDATILHNDYRIGNVVIAPDSPGRVLAVLDWELATLGDPLFDLGYFLTSVPVAGAPLTPTQELSTALLEPGFPSRDELADRYAERTGRDLGDLAWYETLALFKLAALYEYSHRRAIAGTGDEYYRDPALVASFLEAAAGTAGR